MSGRITLGKEPRKPFYRRPGGPQGRLGRVLSPPALKARTLQLEASHYTMYADSALNIELCNPGIPVIIDVLIDFLIRSDYSASK
jgi:hypothetical protein